MRGARPKSFSWLVTVTSSGPAVGARPSPFAGYKQKDGGTDSSGHSQLPQQFLCSHHTRMPRSRFPPALLSSIPVIPRLCSTDLAAHHKRSPTHCRKAGLLKGSVVHGSQVLQAQALVNQDLCEGAGRKRGKGGERVREECVWREQCVEGKCSGAVSISAIAWYSSQQGQHGSKA